MVFGCGGDRDAGKREPMGRVAGELAELPIVTSDNPRSEDPLAIISAVERGLQASGNDLYRVVPDRREAIRRAVAVAGDEEWAVLIAGKGDERVQIVGVRSVPSTTAPRRGRPSRRDMVRRSVAEAAAAMAGELLPAGDPAAAAAFFAGAAIDSRRVRGGELFFALPGARTDGHRYVAAALAAGAGAAVVERPAEPAPPPSAALVRVADTFAALHALTRAVRATVPERLAAITGSAGKTTTKELLAAMLARRFRVAKSPGNLNNLYGFPLALLGIPDDSEWMVAEMGMSEPGELARISRLGRPDVAVFTNVRPVHLEFFGTLQAIAAAKAELLAGLAGGDGGEGSDGGGLVVANADDPQVAAIAHRFLARVAAGERAGRVVWYGRGDGAGLAAAERRAGGPLDVTASEVAPAPAGAVGRISCCPPAASGSRSSCPSTAPTTSTTAWLPRRRPGPSACRWPTSRRRRRRPRRLTTAASSTRCRAAGAWSTTPTTRTLRRCCGRWRGRRRWPAGRAAGRCSATCSSWAPRRPPSTARRARRRRGSASRRWPAWASWPTS